MKTSPDSQVSSPPRERVLRAPSSPYRVKVFVFAGRGGNGCLSFDRGPSRPKGGPDGGNGGNGGNVWASCSISHETFLDCQRAPHIRAAHGRNGTSNKKKGADGEDKVLFVPLGTHIYDESSYCIGILRKHGQRFMLAQGGKGGKGNTVFKNSTERRPLQTTKGQLGEEATLLLKLLLTADVGLLGLPSVGKSTLLSALTRAHPKVGAYPFTTKSPHLGVLKHEKYPWETFTIADLPGLIDGAHRGIALGHDFLEHLEHCRVLLHLLDVTREEVFQDYQLLRKELRLYSPKLLDKEEMVVFSKGDTIPLDVAHALQEQFAQEFGHKPLLCSAKEAWGLGTLKKALWTMFPRDSSATYQTS